MLRQFAKSLLPSGVVENVRLRRFAKYIGNVSEKDAIEFKTISKLVNSGDIVIDLGAAIGLFTKYLSDCVGSSGVVFCFEPIPSTLRILQNSVWKNKLGNVQIFPFAASSKNEYVQMEVPPSELDFYKAKIVNEVNANTHQILSLAVESVVPPSNRISFIKCDVEGHEFQALMGMTSIIKQSSPALLIEIWGKPSESKAYEMLIGKGYSCYAYENDVLVPYKRDKVPTSDNYFFLIKKHIDRLGLMNE